ncbi:MAG: hypothetical protein ACE5H3_06890, partial [Planctomycetota bacterium]
MNPRLPRFLLALAALTGCAVAPPGQASFGVLVMAHGGSQEWNQGILHSLEPLEKKYLVEVAFGMARADTIQEAVGRLEARGVRKIGLVRLFVSGASWYERTEKILGLRPGAPARPSPLHDGHGHDMEASRA